VIRAKGDSVPRQVSAEYAAGLVKDGDWVDYGINTAQPDRFDRALAARKDQLRDVRIRSCLALSHPEFRENLAREARDRRIVPRAFF